MPVRTLPDSDGRLGGLSADQPADEPTTARPTPSRRTLLLIVVPLIALVILSWVADAFWPTLVDSHPLLLIAMNARNRNLALVATEIDPIAYYTVGTVRLVLSDPLFYLLGWFYGESAVKWIENRWGSAAGVLRRVESVFGKAAYPLVFIAPNNLICALAGSSGMRPAVFITLNVSGTVVRLFVIRWLGDVFSVPLDAIRDFIGEYALYILPFTITFVAVLVYREYRRGTSEIQQLRDIGDEFGGERDGDEVRGADG